MKMSKYTTTFLELAQALKGDFVSYTEAVEIVTPYIFKNPIPFYNTNPAAVSSFEAKFVSNYMDYELGFETPDMFIGRLYNRLAVIMPKYVQLYQTQAFTMEQALSTFSETVDSNSTENGTNGFTNTLTHGLKVATTSSDSGETTRTDNLSSNETRNLTRDANQTGNTEQLVSDEPNTTITSNAYASSLTKNESVIDNTDTESGTIGTTNTGTVKNVTSADGSVNTTNSGDDKTVNSGEHENTRTENITRSGFNGDRNKLLAEFRELILNIDEMIINDCADLFMQIF